MKRAALTLTLLAWAAPIAAHPAVSVVIDSRGNVYYSDLKQVWRIAPDGRRTIAVPNVHTHELVLDATGNLYGEHLWYEGERIDKWGHRVWRRSPDGRVTDVIPAREGFLQNYSFVRDGVGNMYWADRDRSAIMKGRPDGTIVTLARSQFRDVRWMTVTAAGIVYLIDRRDLIRVTPAGHVTTLVRSLTPRSRLWPVAGDRHMLMGLWTDPRGNVYVADNSRREVKRVTPSGSVSVAARSRWPWSPTGGVFAPNGDLLLLEYSATHQVRVRRIAHRYLLPPVLNNTTVSPSRMAPRRRSSR